MKHLKVFEIYKAKSVRKSSDNYFSFFDLSRHKKIERYQEYDIFQDMSNEYFFVKDNEPVIYLQFKEEFIILQDTDVKFPVIQFYTVKSEHRFEGVSLVPYEWLLSKYKKVLSDYIQSKGDIVVWTKLFKKYKVLGYDAKNYKTVDDLFVKDSEISSKSIQIYNTANRLLIVNPA